MVCAYQPRAEASNHNKTPCLVVVGAGIGHRRIVGSPVAWHNWHNVKTPRLIVVGTGMSYLSLPGAACHANPRPLRPERRQSGKMSDVG
jgi:hypothetical protein